MTGPWTYASPRLVGTDTVTSVTCKPRSDEATNMQRTGAAVQGLPMERRSPACATGSRIADSFDRSMNFGGLGGAD